MHGHVNVKTQLLNLQEVELPDDEVEMSKHVGV